MKPASQTLVSRLAVEILNKTAGIAVKGERADVLTAIALILQDKASELREAQIAAAEEEDKR